MVATSVVEWSISSLAGGAGAGDSGGAEDHVLQVGAGHDADVDLIARRRHLCGRARRHHAMIGGGRDLGRDQVEAGHLAAGGHQASGERLAHQAETDEADVHRSLPRLLWQRVPFERVPGITRRGRRGASGAARQYGGAPTALASAAVDDQGSMVRGRGSASIGGAATGRRGAG